MAVCDVCVDLLTDDKWLVRVSDRDIILLAQSCERCPLCRCLCDVLSIPADDIRKGTEWPSMEQMRPYENMIDLPKQPRLKVIRHVRFRRYFNFLHDRNLSCIVGEVISQGPLPSLIEPRSDNLSLGRPGAYYFGGASTVGVCVSSAESEISRRSIWSHAGPASLASRLPTILEFLRACRLHHPKCSSVTPNHIILPSRFVYVGKQDRNIEPRLVSSNALSSIERYTTLSHCWGANSEYMPLRTLQSNEAAHRESLPMSMLPKTFRDAASVTRALNIEYIWIDSLCIIQDNREDWEVESAKMASIFEGSFLTIAAVDSPNSNGGLFLDSISPPKRLTFTPQSTLDEAMFPNPQSTIYVRPFLTPQSKHDKLHLYNAPLYQRGWVFQELTLSTRSLHFRDNQMFWKCPSGLRSEDGTLDQIGRRYSSLTLFNNGPRQQDSFDTPRNANETWWIWIENYTSRSLTKPEDRSAAITGVIRHFQRLTGDNPLLGLWESSFVRDLNWSTYENVIEGSLAGPSWSWLSYPERKISNSRGYCFHDRDIDDSEPSFESFEAEWTGSQFTSQLVSSKLFVNGLVRSFEVKKVQWAQGSPRFYTGEYGCAGVTCNFDDGSELIDGLHITCLFLFFYAEQRYSHKSCAASRTENYLIISPDESSGPLPLETSTASSFAKIKPGAYRRRGVGRFELEIIHKDEWDAGWAGQYNSTRRPNPPLMFDECERVTIELA